jgi:hypothetical protein
MGAAAVLMALSMILAGCAGDDTSGDDADLNDLPIVFDLAADPPDDIAAPDPERRDVLTSAALRARLERDLAWHGVTLVETMRAARRDDVQLQSWIDALADNTADLVDAIGLVYGPAAARGFDQQWGQHTQFMLDYALAVRDGDDDEADQQRSNLAAYAADASSFFQTVTAGGLPANAVEELLAAHIEHMYEMLAADDDDDAAATLDAALQDNDYLLGIAGALATAMAAQQPAAFTGAPDTPAASYCTIVIARTGQVVLTDLIATDPAAIDAAEQQFEVETGRRVVDVLGTFTALSSDDTTVVTATADALFDRALQRTAAG